MLRPNDRPFACHARRGSVSRYALALILLVAMIGGIAWVVQYLPYRMGRNKKPDGPGGPGTEKPLLAFTPRAALWRKAKPADSKDEKADKELDPYKEFEQGTSGHYDFLLKNISGSDVDIVFYASDCDCASMKVAPLSAEEHERLAKIVGERPGEPLPFAQEPSWLDLPKGEPVTKKSLRIKAEEFGVVRIGWNANKGPGPLQVRPQIVYQSVEDGVRRGSTLAVPVMIRPAVQFFPPRKPLGAMNAGSGVPLQGDLYAWSATRDKLDLKLTLDRSEDPCFDIKITPLSADECKELEDKVREKMMKDKGDETRVRSGVKVAVTVHEKKGDRQLELGSFYRKLLIHLDGQPFRDMPGPEIVGRVEGDILVGGANDLGRIYFKPFHAKNGGTKDIELSAPESMKLEAFSCEPSWVQIKLTPEELDMRSKRRIWRLEATVPPETPTVRPLDEPDAVVLRIVGPPDRFVRIPLEAQVTR